MNSLVTKEHIEQLVSNFLQGTDMFLVEITISSSKVVDVSIDADSGVDIDACVALSKYIEQHMDREHEDFELTVASAGLSEPFKVYRQYEKNIGKLVFVQTIQEQYVGILKQVSSDGIVLVYEQTVKVGEKGKKKIIETETFFPFSDIKKTKIEIVFKNKKYK